MKKSYLISLLLSGLLLSPVVQAYADEQPPESDSEPETLISSEDQKVIELMELLQKMDLLTEFDVVTAGEVKK